MPIYARRGWVYFSFTQQPGSDPEGTVTVVTRPVDGAADTPYGTSVGTDTSRDTAQEVCNTMEGMVDDDWNTGPSDNPYFDIFTHLTTGKDIWRVGIGFSHSAAGTFGMNVRARGRVLTGGAESSGDSWFVFFTGTAENDGTIKIVSTKRTGGTPVEVTVNISAGDDHYTIADKVREAMSDAGFTVGGTGYNYVSFIQTPDGTTIDIVEVQVQVQDVDAVVEIPARSNV